jgi:hypothetical protein
MGNRGNVVFVDAQGEISPAVYLHWNGGPDSVYAFLSELVARDPRKDASYSAARFVQVVGDFFGTGSMLSLGIVNGPAKLTKVAIQKVMTDLSDNGLYVVTWNYLGDATPFTMRRFVLQYETLDNGATIREHVVELPSGEVAREWNTAVGCQTYANIVNTLESQRVRAAQDELEHTRR